MVNIYRITRYPDRDFITFQTSEDELKRFRYRFPVKISEAKRGPEGGYFTFLRADYRVTFYELIRSYLREHYVAPALQVAAFRTATPLSDLWPKELWQSKVTAAVRKAFTDQGYTTGEEPYLGTVRVVPEQPLLEIDTVTIRRGVRYRVEIPVDMSPILWCEDVFWLFLDGKPASLANIAKVHGEGSPILQAISDTTTRSADQQFDIIQRFIRRIPRLVPCEGIEFYPEPIAPRDLGMETWFWPHDSETCFETSNGLRTIFAQALLEEGSGFYLQPDDIQIVIALPQDTGGDVVPIIAWDRVQTAVVSFVRQALPDVETPVTCLYYPVSGDISDFCTEVGLATKAHSGRRVLGVMATPPQSARTNSDPAMRAVESHSFRVNKELRSIYQNGYTETVDWDNLRDAKGIPYIIHNALMGGLFRLNAQPWKLVDLPFEGLGPIGVYFLGITGSTKDHAISATLFDHEGQFLAFGGIYLEPKSMGEAAIQAEIESLARSILTRGLDRSLLQPIHVVVHVSGEIASFSAMIENVLKDNLIAYDIVQVDSDVRMHFRQLDNKAGTPSNGIAVGSEEQGLAYLITTASVAIKINKRDRYPNPVPIRVRRLSGSLSMKTLAAHVFWLSCAHINSLHRTVDMPITIAYARSLNQHISSRRQSMSIGRTHRRTLYWL